MITDVELKKLKSIVDSRSKYIEGRGWIKLPLRYKNSNTNTANLKFLFPVIYYEGEDIQKCIKELNKEVKKLKLQEEVRIEFSTKFSIGFHCNMYLLRIVYRTNPEYKFPTKEELEAKAKRREEREAARIKREAKKEEKAKREKEEFLNWADARRTEMKLTGLLPKEFELKTECYMYSYEISITLSSSYVEKYLKRRLRKTLPQCLGKNLLTKKYAVNILHYLQKHSEGYELTLKPRPRYPCAYLSLDEDKFKWKSSKFNKAFDILDDSECVAWDIEVTKK